MPFTVGVAGLARGMSIFSVFHQRPDCEVIAVCDPLEGRAEQVAKQHSIPQAVTTYGALVDIHPDIIVVASPLPFHTQQSIQALDAGIHVISEVPAVASMQEARDLVAAARRSSARYSFAENQYYAAFSQTYEHLIRTGQFGRIYYAECEYIHDVRSLFGTPDNPTWRVSLPPIKYCTHDIGPLLWWLDDRIVTATGMASANEVAPEWDCIDAEIGLFRTAKGTIIRFTASFCTKREPPIHGLVLHGTKGVAEGPRWATDTHKVLIDGIPNCHEMVSLPINWVHPHAPGGATAGGHGTAEHYMIDAFIQALHEGIQPPLDVYAALDATLPGICAHESAMTGSVPVIVPDPREF